jgi:uncharacterized protein
MPTRACVLLARAPSAAGKTRLTAHLAADEATALRRALLLDTYEAVSAAVEHVIVAFTPDQARHECEALLTRRGTSFIAQRGHDLGARMHAALADALAGGSERVVLVGSDLPSLPPAHVIDAFTALATHDVVMGPSQDGGYYLVGLKQAEPRLFANLEWGSARVYHDTLLIARALQLTVATIPPWFDIDTRGDLASIQADPLHTAASHTRSWLARWCEKR